MKRSRKILFGLSGLVAFLILLLLLMRYCAQERLDAYKRELLSSGEKLAISDLAPIPSAEGRKNAAALLRAANTLTMRNGSTCNFIRKRGTMRLAGSER
jgi:hypothetical protein